MLSKLSLISQRIKDFSSDAVNAINFYSFTLARKHCLNLPLCSKIAYSSPVLEKIVAFAESVNDAIKNYPFC